MLGLDDAIELEDGLQRLAELGLAQLGSDGAPLKACTAWSRPSSKIVWATSRASSRWNMQCGRCSRLGLTPILG